MSKRSSGAAEREHPLLETLGELFHLSVERLLVARFAGGPDKHAAILGAMRGRFANVLVTDEETAEALLAVSE